MFDKHYKKKKCAHIKTRNHFSLLRMYPLTLKHTQFTTKKTRNCWDLKLSGVFKSKWSSQSIRKIYFHVRKLVTVENLNFIFLNIIQPSLTVWVNNSPPLHINAFLNLVTWLLEFGPLVFGCQSSGLHISQLCPFVT